MTPNGNLHIEPTIRLAEVEWLLDSGEDVDRIAARLQVSPGGIRQAAVRSGRPELVAKVTKGWGRL